jgi:hypothetical protein
MIKPQVQLLRANNGIAIIFQVLLANGSRHMYPWRHHFKVLDEGLWSNMKMREMDSGSF